MEDITLRLGLLMEAAHAQQSAAEQAIARLEAHTGDLDGVLREAVRVALIEELRSLNDEGRRAADSLRRLGRGTGLRLLSWSIASSMLCSLAPALLFWWLVPSQSELAALRERRAELVANIARLEQRGGRVDLRRCGGGDRLCVRVDKKAPVYGPSGDYYVVEGN